MHTAIVGLLILNEIVVVWGATMARRSEEGCSKGPNSKVRSVQQQGLGLCKGQTQRICACTSWDVSTLSPCFTQLQFLLFKLVAVRFEDP